MLTAVEKKKSVDPPNAKSLFLLSGPTIYKLPCRKKGENLARGALATYLKDFSRRSQKNIMENFFSLLNLMEYDFSVRGFNSKLKG